MEILAFSCLTGAVWLFGLAMVVGLRLDLRLYTLSSLVFAIVGLVIFEMGSVSLGLVQFGEGYELSIPRDYVERGTGGIMLICEGILAVVSPLFAAFLAGLRAPNRS